MDIFRTLGSGSLSVTAMLDFSGKANTSIHGLGEDDTAKICPARNRVFCCDCYPMQDISHRISRITIWDITLTSQPHHSVYRQRSSPPAPYMPTPPPPQQTRNVNQCWVNVEPTSNQYWFNVLFLLGALQRQTAVTAYFSSKQLLLFAFARLDLPPLLHVYY